MATIYNYAHPGSAWVQYSVVADSRQRADQILDHFVHGFKSRTYNCCMLTDSRDLPESFQDMLSPRGWPITFGLPHRKTNLSSGAQK